ncbi:MAG: hypothetical protein JNM94_15025 [Phycisphaerae bacterium]|nr:hypothetical protein [Phycisphaerae bacterium]
MSAAALTRAADTALDAFLGVGAGERVALTVPASLEPRHAFVESVRDRLAARGVAATEIPCPGTDLLASEGALDAALAAGHAGDWPDSIIELADISLYQTPALQRFVRSGGRVLSLPKIDPAAAERLLGSLDVGELRRVQHALLVRLRAAERVVVTTGDGRAELVLTLDRRSAATRVRRALRQSVGFVYGATPLPIVRAQFAFLVGQVSIQGRPRETKGTFVADRYLWPPVDVGRLTNPIDLAIRGGYVREAHGLHVPASLRAALAVPRSVEHLSIGFLPSATFDGALLEAERVHGAVTLGFGQFPHHMDAIASDATITLDGRDVLVDRGRLCVPTSPDAARLSAPRPAAGRSMLGRVASILRPIPVRMFGTPRGRIAFAGPCAHEGAWLLRFSERALGPVDERRARPRGLGAALGDADLSILNVAGERLRLEGRGRDMVRVPGLVQQTLDLAGVRANGLKALAGNSNASNDLRVMRKEALAPRVTPLDDPALDRFYERYYAPQLRERYGALAGFTSREDLRVHVGHADLLEIMRGDDAIAATIVRVDGRHAALVQAGLLDGNQEFRRLRGLAATYAFGAQHAVERGADTLGFGGSLPFLRDGVLTFKAKWSPSLVPPEPGTGYAIEANVRSDAACAFLENSPILAVAPDGGLVGVTCVRATTKLDRLFELVVPGLGRLACLLDGVPEEAVRAATSERLEPARVRCIDRGTATSLRDVVMA